MPPDSTAAGHHEPHETATPKEIAAYLRTSPATVRLWIRQGRIIPCTPMRRPYCIRWREVYEFMEREIEAGKARKEARCSPSVRSLPA